MTPWRIALLLALALFLLGQAVFRLAPLRSSDWHRPLDPAAIRGRGPPGEVVAGMGEAWLFLPLPDDQIAPALRQIERVALAQPRTRRLAGSADQGHVTFVSRSLLWGFPDLTTVQAGQGGLYLWARLRFGRGDLGVNAARLRQWQAGLWPRRPPAAS